MKTEFINDFYNSLEKETNPTYTKALKKLIDSKELTQNELKNLISEVF